MMQDAGSPETFLIPRAARATAALSGSAAGVRISARASRGPVEREGVAAAEWSLLCRSLFEHVFDRDLVVCPARPIAQVLMGLLPAFERVGKTILEPLDLLFRCDVQKAFHNSVAIGDQHPFELIDLLVGLSAIPACWPVTL